MKPVRVLTICTLFGPLILLSSCKRDLPVEAAPLVVRRPLPVTPAPKPLPAPSPFLDGTYSSMKHIKGEGDVLGVEVTISNSQGAALVTFLCAQGELPQAQHVAADVSGNSIHFHATENSQCPAAFYTGVVSDRKLILTQDGASTRPEVLVRVDVPGERPKR